MMQARVQRPPPSTEIRAISADNRLKVKKSGDCWDQMRAMLHDAAMEHCVEELQKAWDALEREYSASDPALRPSPTPAMTQAGSSLSTLQEQWYVRHKLYS